MGRMYEDMRQTFQIPVQVRYFMQCLFKSPLPEVSRWLQTLGLDSSASGKVLAVITVVSNPINGDGISGPDERFFSFRIRPCKITSIINNNPLPLFF
jgi:hypothetical protein